MIDLDKLDEYTRKRVEYETGETNKCSDALDKYLESIYLTKVCRLDEFFSNPDTYDDLAKLFEKTGGHTKSTRRMLAVIRQRKKEKCHA